MIHIVNLHLVDTLCSIHSDGMMNLLSFKERKVINLECSSFC